MYRGTLGVPQTSEIYMIFRGPQEAQNDPRSRAVYPRCAADPLARYGSHSVP